MAMACDIRIASENAKMGQTEINIGLIPGWGGTQRLDQSQGAHFYRRNDWRKTAEQLGLVNMVIPKVFFRETVRRFALELAKKPP